MITRRILTAGDSAKIIQQQKLLQSQTHTEYWPVQFSCYHTISSYKAE